MSLTSSRLWMRQEWRKEIPRGVALRLSIIVCWREEKVKTAVAEPQSRHKQLPYYPRRAVSPKCCTTYYMGIYRIGETETYFKMSDKWKGTRVVHAQTLQEKEDRDRRSNSRENHC